MTFVQQLQNITRVFLVAASLCWVTAHAQMNMDTAQASEPAAADWTAGEVRKLDKAAGKLTIRHDDIKNLNMPAMTMVFTVKNKALLDGLKVGDKIQFMAVQEQGKLIVTDIQAAKEGAQKSSAKTSNEGMQSMHGMHGMKHGGSMKSKEEMMEKMAKHIEFMRQMVQKWDAATTPEERQALMEEHHKEMREGMEMSPHKGGNKHH